LVDSVTANVTKSIQPPPTSIVGKIESGAINELFSIAGSLAGAVPGGSQAVGILHTILTVTGVLSNDPNGNSAVVDVQSEVANIEKDTAYGFTQQLTSLGSMFNVTLQDWGKVQSLGKHLSDVSDSGWRWNGTKTTGQLLEIMTYSMETSLYKSVMARTTAVNHWFPDSFRSV
jgi:hypothetical protein